jgi:hypothetical protein
MAAARSTSQGHFEGKEIEKLAGHEGEVLHAEFVTASGADSGAEDAGAKGCEGGSGENLLDGSLSRYNGLQLLISRIFARCIRCIKSRLKRIALEFTAAATEGSSEDAANTEEATWATDVAWWDIAVQQQVFAHVIEDTDFATCCLLLPAELSVTYGTVYMIGLCQGMGVCELFEEVLLPLAQATFPLASCTASNPSTKKSAMNEVEHGVDAIILLCKAHFLGSCDVEVASAGEDVPANTSVEGVDPNKCGKLLVEASPVVNSELLIERYKTDWERLLSAASSGESMSKWNIIVLCRLLEVVALGVINCR